MSGGFVKLDTGITRSSLWVHRDARSLFITALVMAKPIELTEPTPQLHVDRNEATGWVVPPGWYGFIDAAGSAIVRTDGMDPAAGLAVLAALGEPDPESKNPEHDGRRLVRVKGGYVVLNFFAYRDRDYGAADRMRRLRARRKSDSAGLSGVTPNSDGDSRTHPEMDGVTPNVTQAEDRGQSADAEDGGGGAARERAREATELREELPALALACVRAVNAGLAEHVDAGRRQIVTVRYDVRAIEALNELADRLGAGLGGLTGLRTLVSLDPAVVAGMFRECARTHTARPPLHSIRYLVGFVADALAAAAGAATGAEPAAVASTPRARGERENAGAATYAAARSALEGL